MQSMQSFSPRSAHTRRNMSRSFSTPVEVSQWVLQAALEDALVGVLPATAHDQVPEVEEVPDIRNRGDHAAAGGELGYRNRIRLFASPMGEIVRLHASSGTTGKPIVVAYTQGDKCVHRRFPEARWAAAQMGDEGANPQAARLVPADEHAVGAFVRHQAEGLLRLVAPRRGLVERVDDAYEIRRRGVVEADDLDLLVAILFQPVPYRIVLGVFL